jgi:integrase
VSKASARGLWGDLNMRNWAICITVVGLAAPGELADRADQPLQGVTPTDIQSYINTKEEKKWSDKTAALHLQALKSAFNTARRLQLIDSNPADPISVTVEEEVQRELFTEAEAKLILDAAEGEWKTLVLVGYYTGLRLAKAAALRWDVLDLAKKTIFIQKPGKRGRAVVLPYKIAADSGPVSMIG